MKAAKLCASISADTASEMARKASLAFELGSDLVEFRIDALADPSEKEVRRELSSLLDRCVVTVRPKAEGGRFRGREGERLVLISELAELKPAYLDIELSTARKNPRWADSLPKGCERIVSSHDFHCTPALRTLRQLVRESLQHGAIAKVVTTATKPEDNLAVLSLYEERRAGAVISFCMGELGMISRVVSLRMGCPLTYAALPGDGVAPGQLSVPMMKRLRTMLA